MTKCTKPVGSKNTLKMTLAASLPLLMCFSSLAGNISESSGQGNNDWNATGPWGGTAPIGGNNYITTTASGSGQGTLWGVTGFAGRIRVNNANSTFLGGALTVSAGTEVLLKAQTANTSVFENATWVMNGGAIRWGGNGVSPNPSTNQLQGAMNVTANSYLMVGSLTNAAGLYGIMNFNVASTITGLSSLTLLSGNQNNVTASATGVDFLFTGDLSSYTGMLILGNGVLTGEMLELNPINTTMGGGLDIASTDAGTSILLDEAVTMNSLQIGSNLIGPGTYTASQLNALGDGDTFSGVGSITVVPEPTSLALLGAGFLGLFVTLKKRA